MWEMVKRQYTKNKIPTKLSILTQALFFTVLILVSMSASVLTSIAMAETAPSEQWWTALSILLVLFLGVLAIGLYRTHTLNSAIDKIVNIEKVVSNVSRIPPLLIDMQSEKKFTDQSTIDDTIRMLTEIYEDGLVSSRDLRGISTIVWKSVGIEKCYKFRELAFRLDTEDGYNRTYLVNAALLIRDVNLLSNTVKRCINSIDDLERFLEPCKHDDSSFMAHAVIGRYHMMNGEYEKAVIEHEKCLAIDSCAYMRDYIFALLACGEYTKVSQSLENPTTPAEKAWTAPATNRYLMMKEFVKSVLRVVKDPEKSRDEVDEYIKKYNMYELIESVKHTKYENITTYNYYNAITSHIKNLKLKTGISSLYLVLYIVHCSYDQAAENLLASTEGHLINDMWEEAIKNVINRNTE